MGDMIGTALAAMLVAGVALGLYAGIIEDRERRSTERGRHGDGRH